MSIEILKVNKKDKDIIANLMQFYQYDFTDFGGEHLGERAKFTYKYFDCYWEDSDRHPFLILYDKQIAGFSFVNEYSHLGYENAHSIAEFFILRYFRKKGIGFQAAKKIIEKFPGKWEISQTEKNVNAQKFWLKFVRSLKGQDFEKVVLNESGKVVLAFDY